MTLTVYKSSAGSGKTYTLVLEYLLMVLKNPTYYRNILAATFTNKAANEMKSRVLKALFLLINKDGESSDERKALVNQLVDRGLTSSSDFSAEAGQVFTSILHHYNDFNIVTLDSFTHRLVKTFARDLGLPALFEVKIEEAALSRELVDELIAKVGEDEFITTLLLNLIEDSFENESSWRFDHSMIYYVKELLTEESFFELPRLDAINRQDFQHARSEIFGFINGFEKTIRESAASILNLLTNAGLSVDDMDGKSTGIWSVLMKFSNGQIAKTFEQKTVKNSFDKANPFLGKSASTLTLQRFSVVADQVLLLFLRIQNTYSSDYQKYRVCLLLRKNIYSIALQKRIADIVQELIVKNQQVPISEFNKRIANVLFASPAAYIYERLGEKLKSFMLDEFQDTSVLQWQNIIPLIENSLASGNANLVVGDGKQSIYRFRSGEFQQFLNLPSIYKANNNPGLLRVEKTFISNYSEKKLDTNYRSSKVIVDFNNDFFDFISSGLTNEFRKVYDGQQQKAVSNTKPGRVEISFIDGEDLSFPDLNECVGKQVLEIIQKQIAEGFSLRDIAVLVRKKAEGNIIAAFLSSCGIGVVSSDSLLLKSSPAVRLIINTLRFVFYPDDVLNRLEMLLNLFDQRGINQDETQIEIEHFQSLTAEMQIHSLIQITGGKAFRHDSGLFDLAEEIVRSLKLDKKADPYIQFILEVIHEFQVKKTAGFDVFYTFWADSGSQLSVNVPESLNAVKIMTIHKAKGLEFPVVIFPFANDDFNKSTKKYLWLDFSDEGFGKLTHGFVKCEKALQETRFSDLYENEMAKTRLDKINNLYVALTRAENRLYVLTTGKITKSGNYTTLFRDFLLAKGLWQDSQTTYLFENNIAFEPKPRHDGNTEFSTFFVSTDWKTRLKVVAEKNLGDAETSRGEALRIGNLFHEIMSKIKIAADIKPVLAFYRQSGELSMKQHDLTNALLKDLVSNEQTGFLFSADAVIKNEVELLSKEGRVFRADRFIEFDTKVVILDYKTGNKSVDHIQQLIEYRELVSSLQAKPVEALLLYIIGLGSWELVAI